MLRVDLSLPLILRALLVLWAIVAGLGLFFAVAEYKADMDDWVSFFSLSHEQNLPTWYSSSLLLLNSMMLALIAARERSAGRSGVWYWRVLSLIFAYISLDEAVQLHEHWGGWTDAGGIFHFDWVIPATILVTIFLACYFRFLLRLPRESRDGFISAGTLYVGGALGVEFILSYWTSIHGDENLGYALIDFVEESLEILGLTVFLYVLLRHATKSEASAQLAEETRAAA